MDARLDGSRSCSHPACDWPAVASMGFDYESRLTWLEDLHPDPWLDRYLLCGLHGEKFRAPVGWTLDDRRGVTAAREAREVSEPITRIPPPVRVEAARELVSELAEPLAESSQSTGKATLISSVQPLFPS